MNEKNELIEYIKDQISFYTKRKKKLETSIKDKERVGLPVSNLDKYKVATEEYHIKDFQTKLYFINDMTDTELKPLVFFEN